MATRSTPRGIARRPRATAAALFAAALFALSAPAGAFGPVEAAACPAASTSCGG